MLTTHQPSDHAAKTELLRLYELRHRVNNGDGDAVAFELRRDLFPADLRHSVQKAMFGVEKPTPFFDALRALETANTFEDASYAIAMAAELLAEPAA